MITSGSSTASVDRLVVKGLVRKGLHEADARVRVVELTPAGREFIEPAYAAHARTLEAAFEPLLEGERGQLFELLVKLRASTRPVRKRRRGAPVESGRLK